MGVRRVGPRSGTWPTTLRACEYRGQYTRLTRGRYRETPQARFPPMATVADDRRAQFLAHSHVAASRHDWFAEDITEGLARSMALPQDHQRRLRAFYLSQRIRTKVKAGRLPAKRPAIVYGRPADGGEQCDACDSACRPRQLIMEVPRPHGTLSRLHVDCYLLWDDVRRRL